MAELRVLGPLEIVGDEGVAALGAAKQRRLLAALAVAGGRARTIDGLVEAVWGDAQPASAKKLLQVYVSQLRKALPDGLAVVTLADGYALTTNGAVVDATRFEEWGREAVEMIDDDPSLATTLADRALALWRGAPYGEFVDDDVVRLEAARLDELRLIFIETRFDALLRLGRHEQVCADAIASLREHPLRERLQAIVMLALYRSGRQSESLQSFATHRALLADTLGLEPSADLRELQRRILNQDPTLLIEVGTRPSVRLPTAPNALVGRDRDLDLIAELLARDDVRLVVLTGAGGSGKTRLAMESARRAAGAFARGAAFVDLVPLHEPGLVPGAISRAVGLPGGKTELSIDELASFLEDDELLLVLDNAEHLRDAAPLFVELLSRAPGVTLIVTSRAVLHVSGEHVFPVAPLAVDDAVELFRQRALSLQPDAQLDGTNAALVREICRRVDGLPLAIELAASRIGMLAPAELLERLGARLGVLTVAPRDLPARQQTLRETIDWSVGLLADEDRRALARLSVFPSGASLEAIETVCDAGLDAVSALVDHHLVQRVTGSTGPRLSLLETIHEYASELLAAAPTESREIRQRHAAWYTALVDEAEPHLTRDGQSTWFDVLESELENLRATLDQLRQEGDAASELALCVKLSRFWYVRGYLTEGRNRLEAVLEAATGQAPDQRRRAFTAAASLALLQGDYEAASQFAEDALEAAQSSGEPRFIANAHSNLGSIVLAAGDAVRARAVLEEAVRLAREAGDDRVAALAINNLGDLALTVGDYARAAPLFEESLALLRVQADAANIARSLFNNGAVDLMEGRLGAAAERFGESLALSRETGDREDIAWSLLGLAATRVDAGDARRGAVLLGAARSVLTQMNADFKPFERQLDRRTEDRSRALQGDERHDAAVSQGVSMTLDEAVRLAVISPA